MACSCGYCRYRLQQRLEEAVIQQRLEEAAKRKMTPEERRSQAISFVYGQLMDAAPHISREQIAQAYDER